MWNTAAGSIRHFTLCLLHRRTWQRWQTHRFRGAKVSWNSHLCQYMARWVYKKEKLLRANSSEYITSKHAWCQPTWYGLTQLGRATHIWVSKLSHHWFRKWLVACSAPNHYLNQCWLIVDLTPGTNSSESKYNKFYTRNGWENVVCKIATILSGPQCC